ncbi:MAG: helix-turn-helix transcriptional regulator [Ktedonobacterales bacterium]|nr:helix-turn-helix transcriptional regulator [Ktedonobacterales bacterium]
MEVTSLKALIPPTTFLDSMSSGDADATTFALYLATFVSLAITLQGSPRKTLSLFAQRVATVTHDRFRLLLHRAAPAPQALPGRQSVSVQWQTIRYGSLYAIMSASSSTLPILRLPLLDRLAQTCGWLLHGLETDQYVERHHPPLPTTLPNLDHLRPQERAILALMAQGVSTTDISQQLALGRRTVEHYQQHLYTTLGVTNAQDAAYLGLRMGILPEG